MFRSTVTFPGRGQKMRCALASTSGPIQRASQARASNFDPVALCTHTGEPHMRKVDKSGRHPYSASNGVLPLSFRVADRFFSHVACLSASPHKDVGRPLEWFSARTLSIRVRFRRSAMPFSCGVSCVVSFLAVPAFARCLLNASLRYSPPRSEHRALIAVQCCWVVAHASNVL